MSTDKTEAFPSLSPITSSNVEQTPHSPNSPTAADSLTAPPRVVPHRTSTSTRNRITRSGSLLQNMLDSNPPLGAWHAIGEDTSKSPTLPEIMNGSYSGEGWSHEGQLENRNHKPHDIHKRRLSRSSSHSMGSKSTRPVATPTSTSPDLRHHVLAEESTQAEKQHPLPTLKSPESTQTGAPLGPDESGEYPNGYRFPKKHNWKQSCTIFGAAFWKFFTTIKGFLITIYGLNVVAWGAMIFFLLIPGATPAMCKSYPNCEDKRYSARQIWIENCSQILTALFCVTAFGLLPWRLRDFYFMIRYQALGDYNALRRLAGYYRGWYRLPGSEKLPELLGPPAPPEHLKAKSIFSSKKKESDLEQKEDTELAEFEANPAIPLPPWSMPPAPLTGIRARPTKFSALSWMIWMYIWNTLFQVGLCVVMWRYNRFERNKPYFTALVALFIVCGSATGVAAGIIVGREGSAIKAAEGIPVKDYDELESPEDFQERMAKKEKKESKKKPKEHIDKSVQVA